MTIGDHRPRLLLLCLAIGGGGLLAGCAETVNDGWPFEQWERPGEPLRVAMALYSPPNLGENHPVSDEFSTVKRRFEKVTGLYSERVNRLFARWIELDARFQRLNNHWKKHHPGSGRNGTIECWQACASPVLGGADTYLDSIRFQSSGRTDDKRVEIDIKSFGPQGASISNEHATLAWTIEKGRLVVDDVHLVKNYHHTYIKGEDKTTRQNFAQYIDSRCDLWKYWIEVLEKDKTQPAE